MTERNRPFTRADAGTQLATIGLYWDREAAVIICTSCQYALQPKGDRVSRHLGEKHGVSLKARVGLNAFVQDLALPDPNQLDLRADGVARHPHLTVQAGAGCIKCDYRSTSLELVKRHISKMHRSTSQCQNWRADCVRGGLHLQSWTQNGARGYWIVDGGEDFTHAMADTSPRRLRKVAAMHHEEEHRLADLVHHCSSTDVGIDDPTFRSNWMRRTGWQTTYYGVDRRFALQLRQPPAADGEALYLGSFGGMEMYSHADDERCLVLVRRALESFIDRCEDTVRHTDHSIRCWLRSQISGQPYKAPFELPARQSTRTKYRGYMKGTIYFMLRASRLDEATCNELLRLRLSARQRRAITVLWDAARSKTDMQEGVVQPQQPRVRNKAGIESDADEMPIPQTESSSRSLRCHRVADPTSSTVVESSPCLREAVSGDGECRSSEQIDLSHGERMLEQSEGTDDSDGASSSDESVETSSLQSCGLPRQPRPEPREKWNSLQTVGCVSTNAPANNPLADAAGEFFAFLCTEEFVESQSSSALLVYFCGTLGFSPDGLRFERPRNYAPKLSGMIYCVRLCLLEVTLPRFAHSSATWGARPRSGHLKRLNPIRERFLCNGCQAAMGELLSLRACGRAFSRADGPSFRVRWSEDSETVSWDDGQISMDQFRRLGQVVLRSVEESVTCLMYGLTPRIRLEDFRDQWSNQTPGYSFVSDPANNLASAYLSLSSRVCLDPVSGVVTGDRWDLDAVRRYLQEEERLLLQLLLLMTLRGGQAPRTPELTSLECFNGPSTSRGVYVDGGSIAYITRHWKPRQSTNQEFHVARYLPRADSAVIARYLAYIRPFANMLSRQCCGGQKERRLLFATVENPDQPWKVEVVTQALKKLTQEVCGTAFGVQVYRQLSIAITERHVKQISRPFNRYDDKSAEADIEVAFAWQSGHRPLQRGTNYGIDSAYPDSLQPALLRIYRWASGEWHEFLQVDQAFHPEKLPSLTASQLHRQSSSQAIKRRLPAEETDHVVSKYRRRSGRFPCSDPRTLDQRSVRWQHEMIELGESDEESSNDTERNQTRARASPLHDDNISPNSLRTSREEGCARESRGTSTLPLIHPRRLPWLGLTPSPGQHEEINIGSHTQRCTPTSFLDAGSRLASNEDLNRLLSATRMLCRLDYYRRHIPCTPTRPIQGSCICYCPSLQVLLCLSCSRCLNPGTYLQHLKRRHFIAYRQLDLRALARLQQEISSLPLSPVDEISTVSHNMHFFPDLPVTVNNFKCRECRFVDVNRKVVRTHFHSQHQPLTKSVNRKVDYVLGDVPLQTLEGFVHNRKFHFIPKLPEVLGTTISNCYDYTSE